MCGLCLPHCPTYGLHKDEGDSPRGRIALARGLASGQLALTKPLQDHLDRCLTCRACEKVCPAGVNYGALIDDTRAYIAAHKPPTSHRWLFAATQPRLLRGLAWLSYGYLCVERMIGWALRPIPGLGRILQRLPPLKRPRGLRTRYPTHRQPARGTVALFTGCIARAFDTQTLLDAIKVLRVLGYHVAIPPTQTCCGALHQHSGASDTAKTLTATNARVFNQTPYLAKLFLASGCGAQLLEQSPADGWRDLNEFIHEHRDELAALCQTRPLRVALHTPCTQRHVIKTAQQTEQWLRQIPGLSLHPLASNAVCCGAAGLNMLTQPDVADALATRKLAEIKTLDPALVVSSNIGCAWHLAATLRSNGTRLDVLHPISVLARALS
jgi:glycolate oxidase iron-sulfur subunit